MDIYDLCCELKVLTEKKSFCETQEDIDLLEKEIFNKIETLRLAMRKIRNKIETLRSKNDNN